MFWNDRPLFYGLSLVAMSLAVTSLHVESYQTKMEEAQIIPDVIDAIGDTKLQVCFIMLPKNHKLIHLIC